MAARQNVIAVIGGNTTPLPPPPPIPQDVKQRFPSMAEYEKQLDEWRKKCNIAVFGVPSNNT